MSTSLVTPHRKRADGLDTINYMVDQLREALRNLDTLSFEGTSDLSMRVQVIRDAAKRYAAGESVLMELSATLVRVARQGGRALIAAGSSWAEEAASVGLSKVHAATWKALATHDQDVFDQALDEVVATGSPFAPMTVHRRAIAIRYDFPRGPEDVWSGQRENVYDGEGENSRDTWVADAVIGELEQSDGGLSMEELAMKVFGNNPDLIYSVDPMGKALLRSEVQKYKGKHSRDEWPKLFTFSGLGTKVTYVLPHAATLGHARAHLEVQRLNVVRVLRRYRQFRRQLARFKHLPDTTPFGPLM